LLLPVVAGFSATSDDERVILLTSSDSFCGPSAADVVDVDDDDDGAFNLRINSFALSVASPSSSA